MNTLGALIIVATAALAASAAAQPFDLTWHTIDSGGGISAGAGFTLAATIGQPDAGPAAGAMTGGDWSLVGGFWSGAGADTPCKPDCDGSGALDFFDFLCFQNQFAAQDPKADCDASGALDFFDFLCFQNGFAMGCP